MFKIIKKTKAKIIVFLIMIVIASTTTISVNASTDIDYNGKLTNGTSIRYWLAPGNSYTGSTPDAVTKLRYPPGMYNPIVVTLTTNKSDSKMDVYQCYRLDEVNGYAECFRKNSSGDKIKVTDKDASDWLFGEVNLNYNMMEKYDRDLKSTIILHEMLHVYGCKDISNTNSIMYHSTPHVRGMTSDANKVLNNKY